MEADDFKQWLKETMGLDASTIGPGMVDRAVENRMLVSDRKNLAEYWSLLRASAHEQQELIESVVVPETWFFRDIEVFEALVRVYDPKWLEDRPGRQLHLLSLPCSTGEEPYTIAMALLDAGFPMESLSIDAIDISERALSKARRAVYGSNSFRGSNLSYRDRHFRAVQGGWQLSETIRDCVHFRRANLLDTDFLAGETYDAILCRNLLIYFDWATQIKAVNVLSRLLRPDGLLFVGAAEAGLMLSLNYVSAQMPMAFAFRKPSSDAPALPASSPVPQTRRGSAPIKVQPKPKPASKQDPRPPPRETIARAPAPPQESLLDLARQQADIGSFKEASKTCEEHMKKHGPSSQALCLMGLIQGAGGKRTRAEDCFRKALYLDPGNEEALMHLASLLEAKGDIAGGRVLRMRATRHRSKAN